MARSKRRRSRCGESKHAQDRSKNGGKGSSKGSGGGSGGGGGRGGGGGQGHRAGAGRHGSCDTPLDCTPDPTGLLALLASLAQPDDRPQRRINKWTTEEDLHAGPWSVGDEHGNTVRTYEAARAALARAGDAAGEVWLWCLSCHRFFQARHLKLDFLGNWAQCPFDDCGMAGLDFEIMHWEAGRDERTGWPESEQQLVYGMCSDRERGAPN